MNIFYRIFFETQIFLGFGLGLELGFFGFGFINYYIIFCFKIYWTDIIECWEQINWKNSNSAKFAFIFEYLILCQKWINNLKIMIKYTVISECILRHNKCYNKSWYQFSNLIKINSFMLFDFFGNS